MADNSTNMQRIDGRSLPELPSRIGLFGSASGASVEATPFDVVVAIATSGGPLRG